MDWSISYIGVLIAVIFAGLAGSAVGFMYGLSERRASERKNARVLASLRGV